MTFPLIYPMDYVPKFKSYYYFRRFIISPRVRNIGKIESLSLKFDYVNYMAWDIHVRKIRRF